MACVYRELRLSVLSAASKARQHAVSNTTRHKHGCGPETLSADEDLSTSSALPVPAAMLADDDDDAWRVTSATLDDEMTSLLTQPIRRLTPQRQPIRRLDSDQSASAAHVDVVSLTDGRSKRDAMTSSECIYYRPCPETDDVLTHLTIE